MKRRLTLFAAGAVALAMVNVAGAVGELSQKPGTAGCISETGTGGACAEGEALDGANALAVSPDERHVYVAARDSNGVAILSRDTATGELSQGIFGCILESGGFPFCTNANAITSPVGIAVSPDGKNVYVASDGSDAVAVFDREPAIGFLNQKAGKDGCIAQILSACRSGKGLAGATGIAVSPDGKNVYVASTESDAVAVLDRDTATGTLTQKILAISGCVSETGSGGACQVGKALDVARGVTVSADGKNVYVASDLSDAVAVFDRDPASGVLSQKADTAGCISKTGTGGACQQGIALGAPDAVAATDDGRNVYVTSGNSNAVVVFDRDAATGTLSQKVGAAGCVADHFFDDATLAACQDGTALLDASGITVTADGRSVYVAVRDSNALAVFDRDPATGTLSQKLSPAGCFSDTGTGGACQVGTALRGALAVAASADGKSVYVASATSDAVAIFDRALPLPPPPPPAPPPPPPPPPPAPSAVDRVAPVVSGFSLSPRRVRIGRRASFRFRLSERAVTRIVIERVLPRRRGRRAGTLTFRNRPAGQNRIAFRGRIGRRALPVGSYRATIIATDPAGNRSGPRRAGFRIVRR